MKLPPALRSLARKATGSGTAPSITPAELAALAAHTDVLTIAIGVLRSGVVDPALPGEQRVASLATLASVVEREPRDRPIILHCG